MSKKKSLLLVLGFLVFVPPQALAAVQDYQVVRLIAMKSDCHKDTLNRQVETESQLVFHATCKNQSHYPDGELVECSDPDDEMSCVIQTQSKQFNNLQMLQNPQ